MKTREEYLTTAAGLLYQSLLKPNHLVSANWPEPDLTVTCGLSQRSRSVRGQCYPRAQSADGRNQLFISPVISDTKEALEELTWQLMRACKDGGTVEPYNAELGVYSRTTTGQPTVHYADPGSKASQVIDLVIETLGEYPHASLTKGKSDTARQLKLSCNRCDAIWRMSHKWASQTKCCPCCSHRNINNPTV